MLSFTFIGLTENGSQFTLMRRDKNDKPAFYGLLANGFLVDYYISLEALGVAIETIKACQAKVDANPVEEKILVPVWYLDEEKETLEQVFETASMQIAA